MVESSTVIPAFLSIGSNSNGSQLIAEPFCGNIVNCRVRAVQAIQAREQQRELASASMDPVAVAMPKPMNGSSHFSGIVPNVWHEEEARQACEASHAGIDYAAEASGSRINVEHAFLPSRVNGQEEEASSSCERGQGNSSENPPTSSLPEEDPVFMERMASLKPLKLPFKESTKPTGTGSEGKCGKPSQTDKPSVVGKGKSVVEDTGVSAWANRLFGRAASLGVSKSSSESQGVSGSGTKNSRAVPAPASQGGGSSRPAWLLGGWFLAKEAAAGVGKAGLSRTGSGAGVAARGLGMPNGSAEGGNVIPTTNSERGRSEEQRLKREREGSGGASSSGLGSSSSSSSSGKWDSMARRGQKIGRNATAVAESAVGAIRSALEGGGGGGGGASSPGSGAIKAMKGMAERGAEGVARGAELMARGADAAKQTATGALMAAKEMLPMQNRSTVGTGMGKGVVGWPTASPKAAPTLVPPPPDLPALPPIPVQFPPIPKDLLADINPAHGRRGDRKWIALDLDPKPWQPPPPGTPPTPIWHPTPGSSVVVRLRMIPSGADCPPLVYAYERPSLFGRHSSERAEAVLKVRQGMTYGVIFRLMPDMHIRCKQATLSSKLVSATDLPPQVVLEDTIALNQCREGFCGTWICNMASSRNGVRHNLNISLEIKGFGFVELPFAVKSFPEEDYNLSVRGAVVAAITSRFELEGGNTNPRLMETEVHPSPWKL